MAGNGTSIQLFDGHGCDGKLTYHASLPSLVGCMFCSYGASSDGAFVTGKTSGKIAPWGTIEGTLADSVDSFILCYEPLLLLGEPGRPYPTNIDD